MGDQFTDMADRKALAVGSLLGRASYDRVSCLGVFIYGISLSPAYLRSRTLDTEI